MKHTPTPWIAVNRGNGWYQVGQEPNDEATLLMSLGAEAYGDENAAFIVRAVNSHEDYKEVAMYARALLKALAPRFYRTGCSDTEQVAIKCLRESIAKAEAL